MRRWSLSGIITAVIFGCVLGAVLLLSGVLVAGDGEGTAADDETIQPAKAAQTKEEALKLAKEEDLPAIARADKAVIKRIFDEEKEITVEDEKTLKKIHKTLTVEQVAPTLGMTKYKLHFYLGDVLIREIYVFPYGECYIAREGTDWVLGLNEELADLLDELFEEDD